MISNDVATITTLLPQTGQCPACGGAGCAVCARTAGVSHRDGRTPDGRALEGQALEGQEPDGGTPSLPSATDRQQGQPHLSAPSTAHAAVDLEAALSMAGSGSRDSVHGPDQAEGHEPEQEDGHQTPTRTPRVAALHNDEAAEQSLDLAEQSLLQELQQRDREVRAHEQAHIAAGGRYAGGATFSYETGPDGQQYAVGGEVSIDASKVPGDPEASQEKARTIRRAALAPASPSAQDMKVAAQAANMEAEARMEALQEKREKETGGEASPLGGTAPSTYGADQEQADPAALMQADRQDRPLEPVPLLQDLSIAVEIVRSERRAQPSDASQGSPPYPAPGHDLHPGSGPTSAQQGHGLDRLV